MFEQMLLTTAPASNRLWSTCAGITGQALLVGCLLLAPLIWPQVLPQLQSYATLVAPGPPPPPPPPPGNLTVRPRPVATTRSCLVCMPLRVPEKIAIINEDPPEVAAAGVTGGVQGGVEGGVTAGVLGAVIQQGAYAPPPHPVEAAPAVVKPAPAPAITRHRVGGLVKLASPIRRVEPVYPAIAKQARIEGVVQLEGVIGVDGRIHELKVLSGHPFLVKAAVEAVQQWLYEPGTLNGDRVEVVAPITVTFRIGGR